MPKVYYIILLLFYLCCTSMSHCDKVKGPLTTVTGRVSDSITNEGYSNIPLQIVRRQGTFGGSRYKDFDEITTDADGQYKLTFTPEGVGDFTIYFKDYDLKKYNLYDYGGSDNKLKLGETNTVNFKVAKLVNLKISLINRSTQNRNNFHLTSDVCCIHYWEHQRIITDTILNYLVPRFSKITLKNQFHNSQQPSSLIEFKHYIEIGNTDTTISIINP